MRLDLPDKLKAFIDLDIALRFLNGNREALAQLLVRYVEWEKDATDKLRLLHEKKSTVQVLQELHRLKTSLGQIGSQSLKCSVTLTEDMFRHAEVHSDAELNEQLEAFCESFDQFLNDLKFCMTEM